MTAVDDEDGTKEGRELWGNVSSGGLAAQTQPSNRTKSNVRNWKVRLKDGKGP